MVRHKYLLRLFINENENKALIPRHNIIIQLLTETKIGSPQKQVLKLISEVFQRIVEIQAITHPN